jgi:chemotaxis protein methyltransferase CheR
VQRLGWVDEVLGQLGSKRNITVFTRHYQAAMLLAEHFPELAGWTVQILATDINKRSLRAAREGIYRKRAVRLVEPKYLERCFDAVDDLYVVESEIKERVRFEYLNLKDDPFPSRLNDTCNLDLIFCRNVMIYFSRKEQSKILTRFARSLGSNGFLVLGRAETMVGDVRPLYQTECPAERIYRCIASSDDGDASL